MGVRAQFRPFCHAILPYKNPQTTITMVMMYITMVIDGHDVHDIRWQFTLDDNRRQFVIDGNPKYMTKYGNC